MRAAFPRRMVLLNLNDLNIILIFILNLRKVLTLDSFKCNSTQNIVSFLTAVPILRQYHSKSDLQTYISHEQTAKSTTITCNLYLGIEPTICGIANANGLSIALNDTSKNV